MNRLATLLLLTTVAMTACMDRSRAYLPSDDALVLARFERLLNRHHIAYRKNADGTYTPVNPQAFERMVALGSKALNIKSGRSGLVVKTGCALTRLKSYLDSHAVVYVITQAEGQKNLIATKSDFRKNAIMARYAGYETGCAQ